MELQAALQFEPRLSDALMTMIVISLNWESKELEMTRPHGAPGESDLSFHHFGPCFERL